MIPIEKITPEPEAVLACGATVARPSPATEDGSALDSWENEGGRIPPPAIRSSRD